MIGRRFIESAPAVRRLRAAVPAGVEEAVARALALEPADRFQTAAEFAQALAGATAAPTPAPLAPQARTVPTRTSNRRRRRVPPGVALLGLGFVLGLGVLFAWLRPNDGTGASTDFALLAVLPFENLGDTADAYFADGVSDAVRGKLAALPGFRVIAVQAQVSTGTPRSRPKKSPASLVSGTCSWARCAVKEGRGARVGCG